MKIKLNEVSTVRASQMLKDIPNHSFFIHEGNLYVKMAGHECRGTVVISICPSNLSQTGHECGVTTICCKIFNCKIVSFEHLYNNETVEPCEIIDIEYCLTKG